MPRGNPQNFKPLSTEEARKRGKAGGKKSAEVRRWKGDIKACILERLGDDATMESLVSAMLFEAVEKGSVQAAAWLRDTAGQKPVDQAKVEAKEEVVYKWKGAK